MSTNKENKESISEKLKAVYTWLHNSKDEIDNAGHEILFLDVTNHDTGNITSSVICSVSDAPFAHNVYEILKQRFQRCDDYALFKNYLMDFVHELQLHYEADYAEQDSEMIESAIDTMQSAIEEHADKFHELFDDDDDPELSDDIEHALQTLSEIGSFFGFDLNDDDDEDDDVPVEFDFDNGDPATGFGLFEKYGFNEELDEDDE